MQSIKYVKKIQPKKETIENGYCARLVDVRLWYLIVDCLWRKVTRLCMVVQQARVENIVGYLACIHSGNNMLLDWVIKLGCRKSAQL